MAGHGCKTATCSAVELGFIIYLFSFSFILEGLLTFVVAIPAWWLIPDFPEDGRVFRGIDQKRWLHRLRQDQGVTNASIPFSMEQVRAVFVNWKSYVYSLM